MNESERTLKVEKLIEQCDNKFPYKEQDVKYKENLKGKSIQYLTARVSLLENRLFSSNEKVNRFDRQLNKEHLAIELCDKEGLKISNVLNITNWDEHDKEWLEDRLID